MTEQLPPAELVAASPAAAADQVPMPQNADQAAGMALVGQAWLEANAPERLRAAAAAPTGFVLVPKRLTRAMSEIINEDSWDWADLLAAAEAITEDEYNALSDAASPAAAAACPTCGESEPFTGRCGTNDRDTKALCKRAAAAADWQISAIADKHASTLDGPRVLDEVSFGRELLQTFVSPVAPAGAPTVSDEQIKDLFRQTYNGHHFVRDPVPFARALLSAQGCELATDATPSEPRKIGIPELIEAASHASEYLVGTTNWAAAMLRWLKDRA